MAEALRDVAAHVPARRAMAIQHRIARARRPPRARVETAARGVLPHAHLRATGYERHRLHSPRRTGPAPADSVPNEFPDREARAPDPLRPERVDRAAAVSVWGGGPRVDDRRLPCVRSAAPKRVRTQGRTTRVAGIGASDDPEPSDARADGRRRSDPRWPGLGFRRADRHNAGRRLVSPGPLWLERRLRHVLVQRSEPKPDRDRDVADH